MNADIPVDVSPRNWSLKMSVTCFSNDTGCATGLPRSSWIVNCFCSRCTDDCVPL